ncbi:MAG: hypothetical protein CFE31_15900 [Rhizobiales bacterium PAR1]|nr:MAG: hypothetical protein CFE31_15900 [Rhizobiales bacterium PAR1]
MNHIERQHAIVIPLALEAAFPLFTPLGEKLWFAEWQPEFIHPVDGTTQTGMVFRTRHGAEETLWSCIDYAPEAHRIRYARVSPATRFVTIDIVCRAESAATTSVSVVYAMTALSPKGESLLAATTHDAFRTSIEHWQTLVTRYAESLPA